MRCSLCRAAGEFVAIPVLHETPPQVVLTFVAAHRIQQTLGRCVHTVCHRLASPMRWCTPLVYLPTVWYRCSWGSRVCILWTQSVPAGDASLSSEWVDRLVELIRRIAPQAADGDSDYDHSGSQLGRFFNTLVEICAWAGLEGKVEGYDDHDGRVFPVPTV